MCRLCVRRNSNQILILSKLRKSDKVDVARVKENVKMKDKFQLDNFDLITLDFGIGLIIPNSV